MTPPVEVKATKGSEKRLPAFAGLGNPHRALATTSNGFFLFLDPPALVNIFFVHLLLDRGGLPIATFIAAAELSRAWI
jgi:hypothetical protein